MDKWISVKDRLPEVNGYYLVYVTKTEYVIIKLFRNDRGGWVDFVGITHWMPLPEPPKKVYKVIKPEI